MRMDVKGDKVAEAKILAAQAKVLAITKAMESMTMGADTKKLDAQILAKQAEVRKLEASMSGLKMDADATKVALKIAMLEAQAEKLEKQLEDMPVDADVSVLEAKFNAVHAELALLKRDASKLDLAMSNVAALRNLAVVKTELALLQEQARNTRLGVDIDPAKLVAGEAGLLGIEASMQKLDEATKKAAADSNAFVGVISGTRWWNISILGVGAWHVVLDGLLETLIAVTGATIALAAGVLGTYKAAMDVAHQLNAMNTVSVALNQNVGPLTGSITNLNKALAPRVIEAFGGGLALMRSQTGSLLHEIEPVVNLFDTWIAKIDLWVANSHQFGKAVSGGLGYLQQFGQIFGNIGVAISSLLSKDPGIATLLGNLIIFGTQAIVLFSKLPAPLVETALALHGIYLWGKVLLVAPILAYAKSLGILSTEQIKAVESSLHFRNILSFLTTNPFGWAVDAAAAIGYLAYESTQASNATKAFIGNLEQGLSYLSGGSAILQISDDIGQLNAQIAKTNVASEMKDWNNLGNTFRSTGYDARAFAGDWTKTVTKITSGDVVGGLKSFGKAVKDLFVPGGGAAKAAQTDIAAYRGEIVKLTAEQDRMFKVTGRLVTGQNDLHIGTLSVTQAWALMGLAGVKANDSFDIMWQKVENLVGGYKGLSIQGSILKNSVDAISFATLQQESKVSELNSSWDAFFKTITGGESGFLSFAQQTIGLYQVMSQTAVKVNESNGKVSSSMQGLAKASGDATVSMTGLNNVSINARQTFLQSADAANQQLDNLTLLASAAGLGAKGTSLLAQATKDMVSSLLPAASGSQALTDVLYALAQRGGYGGANSFKELSKWAGKTKDPLQDLDKITTTLTTSASNLTQDVKNLSVALGQTLNQAMASAILQAGGGQQVFDDFANAVLKTKFNSQQQISAAQALGSQLLALTGNTQDAHNEFDVFAQQMHLTRDQADTLWAEISGKLTPALNTQAAKAVPDAKNAFVDWAKNGIDFGHDRADALWSSLTTKLGPELNGMGDLAGGTAKKKFIDWAENGLGLSQTKAQALWKELVTLQNHINNLQGKDIVLTMQATGSGGVKVSATQQGIAAKLISLNRLGLAAGGFISGGQPGKDSVAAMLMPGEVVVPTNMVNSGAVDHLRGKLPGFAAGGQVGGTGVKGLQTLAAVPAALQNATSVAVTQDTQAALTEDLTITLKNMIAQMKAGDGPAVLQYAESFLHKVPYVWGGSTPAGWDCSGFVSYVYDHFGLFHGRTDAAGLQNWARASAPTPGGLAFYGTPAHHVGFVVNASTLLSALGTKWGTTESALNMGDNSGYGVPPQGFGTAGGVPGGGALPKGKLQELAYSLLNQYGWASQWNAFNLLETREAGWNMNAVNPSSGAAGLAQFINGWSEYYQYGGNPNTALGQLTAMLNYIGQRYPSGPNAAWAHEVADNWYGKGGLVLRMASGGQIPLGKYLPQLKAAQGNEYEDYAGLRKAYLGDIAHAKKGSWTSGHKAGIRSELATLAKRQSDEEAAYDNILHHGTSKANLAKFATRVKAVTTTSRDKDLTHSHPGWSHGLQYWLGVLSHLSQANVAPVYGGTQAKLQFPAWLAKAKATQAHEVADYRGLEAAFASGLRHASHGSWLYKNRKAIGERLYAVAVKQNAEAAAYSDLIKHSTGSISDLTGLPGRIGKLGSQATAEAGSLQPSLLGHLPGGHPGWVKALQAQLKALSSLTAALPYNPPWAPGNLGASHSAPGGVLRFDTGRGVLAPGMNLAWNGTGRPEALSASGAGSGGTVTLEFAGGGSDLEQLLFQIIRRTVRVRGGGNVQAAFGRGT